MAFSDYVELMKLRIAALLLLVAVAGFVCTAGLGGDPSRFALLLVSGLLAAGGASALNHYVDRDLDGKMERTRTRPLPARRIKPAARALEFGIALTVGALAIAFVGINPLTAGMIALGTVFYVGVYTLGLKRIHVSSIVIGGFAGSCPALAGSAAAANAISLPAVLLALLVFLWTPGHFWALAYRSRGDYRRAGIPMLPAVWDERSTIRAIAASTVLVPAVTFTFVLTPPFGLPFLAMASFAGGILLALTIRFARRPSEETAWAGYKFSGAYLALLLAAAMVDAVFPSLGLR